MKAFTCGADLVKVGIGGGSVCTTRIKNRFWSTQSDGHKKLCPATIRELQRKLDYMEITPAGRWESLPHRTL